MKWSTQTEQKIQEQYLRLKTCQLLSVQELLEIVITEAVIQKGDQCTNTSRYQYGYEVVRGKGQAIL